MDDNTAYATILAGSGVTIVGIVKWMFERQVKRFDEMEENIEELKSKKICKDDLDKTEDRLSRTILNARDQIQHALETTNTRVDKLFERIPK